MSEAIAQIDLKLDYVVYRDWGGYRDYLYFADYQSSADHPLSTLWTQDHSRAERFSRGEAAALMLGFSAHEKTWSLGVKRA